MTSPAEGQAVETKLSTVRGTGEPGATVTVTGDVKGTAKVDAEGTWAVDAGLSYGSYT
ncbi:Ig-like domain-containing protein, partial [Pseudomonas viridiflava]|uniref:Ig-like domain-containing protein n=1 Tax=Pseudomonas viridiflava TaxID=33069 RepID=UPI002405A688